MQAIVIGTTPGSPWLADCLASLSNYHDYPLLILCDLTWELGKMKFIMEHTNISEFFFVHDSCVIKNPDIFRIAFEHPGSYAMAPNFMMYLGKYTRENLSKHYWSVPRNKEDSVLGEGMFNGMYLRTDPNFIVCPQPMIDSDIFVERHGRDNMKIENDWMIKYKGTWKWDQAIAR